MAKIKVSAFGAYLTSWQIEGREVLYQGSELKRTGIPLLFPNFDAGAPLPNHGFGRLSTWRIIEESENNCYLQLTENEITPEFRQLYPYPFIANLKIKASHNQLDYCLEVKNLSEKNLPLSPGLHPYWPVKHELKSQIKLVNFSQFNSQNIDWDKKSPDDTYDFHDSFWAIFPDYQLIIKEIKEGGTNHFHHLQIWSQNLTFPDHDFVCFEPVTRPKNGIISDPILVNSNDTSRFHLQFQVIFP